MPTRLIDIKPAELSLVARGANKRQFLFAKGDDEPTVDEAIAAALEKSHEGEDEVLAVLKAADASDEVVKSVIGACRLLKSVELPDEVTQIFAGEAKPAPAPAPVRKNDGGKMPAKDALPVPVQKEDGSWDLSGVPADARGFYETVLKDAEEARAKVAKAEERAEAAEKIAKAEEDKRVTREFIAKAEELDSLPGTADELGPVLKEIAGTVSAETYEKLETLLKSANAVVETSDFYKELGGRGKAPSDAEGRIEKAAEKLREADPDLTKEQAIAKALDANPELYDAYLRERG